jgi:hypothetical protein
LFKNLNKDELKPITVPQYKELSPKALYENVKAHIPDLVYYFPEYEEEYIPSKKFFWDIFATLDYELAKNVIDYAISVRTKGEGDGEDEKEVEVADDIMKELLDTKYYSKKKGKAIFMLSAANKYQKVQRKRKREFKPLDLGQAEINRKVKRVKKNEDEGNKQSLIDNFIQKVPKKSDKKEEEKDEREDLMNVDVGNPYASS